MSLKLLTQRLRKRYHKSLWITVLAKVMSEGRYGLSVINKLSINFF